MVDSASCPGTRCSQPRLGARPAAADRQGGPALGPSGGAPTAALPFTPGPAEPAEPFTGRPGSTSLPLDPVAWRRQLRPRRSGWAIAGALTVVAALVGFALPASASRTSVVEPRLADAKGATLQRGADDSSSDGAAAPSRARHHGPAGSVLLEQYAKLDAGNEPARHRFVLEQIAKGNLPSSWDRWVTVHVRGSLGTEAEFDVSPHGLRIGNDDDWVEIPLDGPHSAAAAELLGCRLGTAWMVEKTYEQARLSGTVVHFFAAAQIADALKWYDWQNNAPDGEKMKGATFFRQRNVLLHRWLEQHPVAPGELVAGYFKSVVPPVDGLTRPRGLEIVGGRDDTGREIQPLSGGLHWTRFFDYSQNVRLVRDEIRVDGKPLSLAEFFANVGYAREFRFRYTAVPERPYRYPAALSRWMDGRTPRRAAPTPTR